MPSFSQDIRPLFRDKDVEEMRFAFDLSDEVKTHGQGIYDRLVDGSMPCDGAWLEDRIALFRQWIDGGYLL